MRRPAICTSRKCIAAQARRMLEGRARARRWPSSSAATGSTSAASRSINTVDRERFPSFNNELRAGDVRGAGAVHASTCSSTTARCSISCTRTTRSSIPCWRSTTACRSRRRPDRIEWVRVDDADAYGRGGLAADGGVSDQERAGPAHQSGEARLLGGAARAGRADSAAAGGRARTAARRSEAGRSAAARDAGAASRRSELCGLPRAVRFVRLVFEGYGPIGERRDKDLAGRPVDARATFPGGSEGAGVEGLREYIREHRQRRFRR